MENNIRRSFTLEDYIITKSGDVFNKRNGRKIKPWKNNRGYYCFRVHDKKYFVHRVVAELYIPNPENKPQVNHIDGDKSNNSVENLEWVTIQENFAHASAHELIRHGEKCSWAKLTKEDVDYIRSHTELSSRELSNMFNSSSTNIRSIRRHEIWK